MAKLMGNIESKKGFRVQGLEGNIDANGTRLNGNKLDGNIKSNDTDLGLIKKSLLDS